MTYQISTYDPLDDSDEWDWHARAKGLSLWSLRSWVKELRQRGYSDELSILVEREDKAGERRMDCLEFKAA